MGVGVAVGCRCRGNGIVAYAGCWVVTGGWSPENARSRKSQRALHHMYSPLHLNIIVLDVSSTSVISDTACVFVLFAFCTVSMSM
eukprot:COSAG06_NODE_238_length_19422_cov_16.417741_10_plen_85_part_00